MSDKSTLSVRISSELKQKLVHEAQKLEMTVTELVEFKLNESSANSPAIANKGSLNEIKTLLDNNKALKGNEELKEIMKQIIIKNNEILKNTNRSIEDGVVYLEEGIKQKLIGIFELMKEEDVRYEKDDEVYIATPKNIADVVRIIIHNYHSLIVNEKV